MTCNSDIRFIQNYSLSPHPAALNPLPSSSSYVSTSLPPNSPSVCPDHQAKLTPTVSAPPPHSDQIRLNQQARVSGKRESDSPYDMIIKIQDSY